MTIFQDRNELESNSPVSVEGNDLSLAGGARSFEIHVRGHLNSKWSDWLGGLEMKLLDGGEMVLCGPIVDQAALIGVLNKLNRLNLTLISVNEVKEED